VGWKAGNEVCQDSECFLRQEGLGEVKHYLWQCGGQAPDRGPSLASRLASKAFEKVKDSRNGRFR